MLDVAVWLWKDRRLCLLFRASAKRISSSSRLPIAGAQMPSRVPRAGWMRVRLIEGLPACWYSCRHDAAVVSGLGVFIGGGMVMHKRTPKLLVGILLLAALLVACQSQSSVVGPRGEPGPVGPAGAAGIGRT